ncbi:MAG: class II aldolase/adducin family protein [Actinomycetota bacterium]|nr:class II aldolase/adducin family protein [Actinomycetota bacterium]
MIKHPAFDSSAGYPAMVRGERPHAHFTLEEELAMRKWQCAIGYRIFGGLRWGQMGDGHISSRDPFDPDHFWILGFGVPFREATIDALVKVSPEGDVVEGSLGINDAAYYIHSPVLAARPDAVCAAHTHTPYGTAFSALVEPFRAVSQESTAFVFNQSIFDDEELDIYSTEGGHRIGEAVGSTRLCFLRNHGMLTVGSTVAEAVGFFVMAERVAEVHIKAPLAKAISDEGAKKVGQILDDPWVGNATFEWLARDLVPDPSVVH